MVRTPNKKTGIAADRIRRKMTIESPSKTSQRTTQSLTLRMGIKSRELVRVIRQLATLIRMRMTLDASLAIIEEQVVHKRLKSVITDCRLRIRRGQNLSDALRASEVFPESVIRFAAVGEMTGQLGDTLTEAAEQMEKIARLKRKILTALSYPMVILVVAGGAIGFLLLVVVPTFSEIFSDFGGDMPAATRMLLSITDFIQHRWYIIPAGLALFLLIFRTLWRRPACRIRLEALVCKIPVFGSILFKSQMGRFIRTLSSLLQNGIPLTVALVGSGNTSGSLRIVHSTQRMTEQIKHGVSLNQALRHEKLYPVLLAQMARVGEESGALAGMLDKIAEYYETEIDAAIETLNAIIEPILIVGLGIVLGGILVAMYMQIFSVVDVVR